MREGHYSYSIYGRREFAERFDDEKFSGPIGEMVSRWEETTVKELLGNIAGRRILDVGAGTGRISISLTKGGASVTGVDSSPEMLRRAGEKTKRINVRIRFLLEDAQKLSFRDISFDNVVCLRTLMHVADWEKALSEVCRVARSSVVFDFPPLSSASFFAPLLLRVKRLIEPDTQVYRCFSVCKVRRALLRNGFYIKEMRRQFVLPFFIHRKLRCRLFTENIESFFRAIGLLRLFGAPVILSAERGR